MPPEDAPVSVRRRRLVTENTKWRVFSDDISGSDGATVDGYLFMTPCVERPDRIGGVTALPVMLDGTIGLVRYYRHPVEEFTWEAPRGFLDPGETDVAGAALRELTEETGLTCARDKLIAVGHLTQEASTLAVRGALFIALDCRKIDPSEHKERGDHVEPGLGALAFHTLDAALALADRGEIQDAATLISLYRYALRRPGDRQAR